MEIVFDHLKSQSVYPALYEEWRKINDRWFDGQLLPIPISVIQSKYGKFAGYCLGMDHIAIQPSTYAKASAWQLTLHHEICHQADCQEGIRYPKSTGRLENIHNSQEWCDRINEQMSRMGDNRFAMPYRRNREGRNVCTGEAPEGRVLMEYQELKTWHPRYPAKVSS